MRNVTPFNLPFKITPLLVTLVLLGLFVLVMIATSVFIVGNEETVVILRFGKYTYELVGTVDAGLHLKLPFGIEKDFHVPTARKQDEEFGFITERAGEATLYRKDKESKQESAMLTGDLNIVHAEWSMQYYIEDPRAWLFNVENKKKTIRDISRSVINMLIGDRHISDALSTARETIQEQAALLMNEYFDKYDLGIHVKIVKFKDVAPPEGEVKAAFQDVNAAEKERDRLESEGKQEYQREIPRALGEAKKILEEAEGYAINRVNIALGEVERFKQVYSEYRRAPRVTRARLYYEMYEDVFRNEKDMDLIDRNLKSFIPFKSLSGDLPGGTR